MRIGFGGEGGVPLFYGDDAAGAAAWVGDVSCEARNDVDVEVHHRLAGGLAGVEADVVAIRREFGVEGALDVGDGAPDLCLLDGQGFEVRLDVAPGDDEGVPGAHRVAIPD